MVKTLDERRLDVAMGETNELVRRLYTSSMPKPPSSVYPDSVYDIEQWVAYIKAMPSAEAADALREMIRENVWAAGCED